MNEELKTLKDKLKEERNHIKSIFDCPKEEQKAHWYKLIEERKESIKRIIKDIEIYFKAIEINKGDIKFYKKMLKELK